MLREKRGGMQLFRLIHRAAPSCSQWELGKCMLSHCRSMGAVQMETLGSSNIETDGKKREGRGKDDVGIGARRHRWFLGIGSRFP